MPTLLRAPLLRAPVRPAPHFREPSAIPVVGAGTVAWTLVFAVVVLGRDSAWMQGHQRWIAVAGAAVVLGLLGLAYCWWRERRLARLPVN